MSDAKQVEWLKGGMWHETQAHLIGKQPKSSAALLDLVLQAEVDRKDIDRKRVEHERAKKLEALTQQATQQVYVAPQRQPNNIQGSTRNAQGHGGFGQGGCWRDGPIRGGYGRGNFGSWRNNYAQGGQGQDRYNQSAGQPFNGLCFRCNQPGHLSRNCPWSKNE
ncbi:unnamed protein product [Didymodactylos carnosus]|uniref:CCHC-type domain-containing protein n=2 Tax=Didymodactylos carnosus TaxID=1234261 RepID=A0A8S2VJN2_9BILA|nr:unnamed protein product [Didymodactylos carnosus]